ncbi:MULTISPECIES: hypothetical protein [unclassified Streptomyces]|uniref:hypothetical protein n=1 Tax=unclassified Streptomyces TaxID=2593676 RepID=UPI003076A83B
MVAATLIDLTGEPFDALGEHAQRHAGGLGHRVLVSPTTGWAEGRAGAERLGVAEAGQPFPQRGVGQRRNTALSSRVRIPQYPTDRGSPWPAGHRFSDRTRAKDTTVHALLAADHSRGSIQRPLAMTYRTVQTARDAANPRVRGQCNPVGHRRPYNAGVRAPV